MREPKIKHWYDGLTTVWDWIDSRDIDKHVVSVAILIGTWKIVLWAMAFATTASATKSGTDVAAIIAAIMVPYSALQAAAINFYFRSRDVSARITSDESRYRDKNDQDLPDIPDAPIVIAPGGGGH